MAQPQFTMRELMDAGVHFGHKTKRWNPKMAPFLFGIRNDIHIIDLQQTVPMMNRALKAVSDVLAKNGRILFVGTKRQSQEIIAENATRCGQYYVNHRWLGGMLTNWKTISASIKRLRELEEHLSQTEIKLTKNERLQLTRQREKLEKTLGGIREMGTTPNLIFVVDTNQESIAVKEANKLGIPVIGVLDSNSDPDGIAFPIPGNDDSARSIELYCRLISDAALHGIEQGMIRSGAEVGKSADSAKSDKLKKAAAKAKNADVNADDAKAEASKADAPNADDAKAAPAKKAAAKPAAKAPAKKPATKTDAEEVEAKKAANS